ncbi:MAG: ABC transporter ATP-binding protein [Lentisphaerae bacterium]|nr:ABC transporter ATP-binding protein [Lentisphaerota bacterium]
MVKLIAQLRILLSRRDKIALAVMALLSFIAALWELCGVGLAVPIVAAAVNPQLLEQNEILRVFYQLMPCREPRGFMLLTALLLVVNFALKSLFNLYLLRMESRFVYRKQQEWSIRLFEKFTAADYQTLLQIAPAEISARISRVGNICEGSMLPLMQGISDCMVIGVILIGVMFFMPGYLTLALGMMLIAAGGLYCLFRKFNGRKGAELIVWDNAVAQDKFETFSGIKSVKTTQSESFFRQRFGADITRYSQVRAQLYFWGQLPRFTLEFMTIFMAMAIFSVMIWNNVPTGTVVLRFALLIAAVGRILPALSRLHYNLTLLKQISQVLKSLFEDITALPPESEGSNGIENTQMGLHNALEIRDLSFAYPDGKKIFENFNLTIPALSSAALIGPTGGGKTTLADLIIGLLKPAQGGIYFDGVELQQNLAAVRSMIAYVPQFVFLFDGSIKENVALGCNENEVDDAKLERALQLADLSDYVKSLPDGVDSRIGEGGANISGGQRQRLGIARALYRDAELLILDEPTSALDENSENCIVNTLKALQGQKTILVIAHRLSTIQHCDIKIPIGN